MRIPLSWMKEYIHLKLSPAEIDKMMTMIGLEVEGIESSKLSFSGVVVAKVTDVKKHPNADQLCLATVTDGKEVLEVVCGAKNAYVGMKTAFAPIGAVLKGDDGKEFKIKRSKIRGVESPGMLCSGGDLQISQDDDGILDLPQHLKEGTLLSDLYSDTIIEVGLTPNLSHCSSVYGVARELSAATGLPLHPPAISFQEGDEPISNAINVTISDPKACPRYTCRLIKGVKVGPSPEWLRARIEQCGLRSVNNVVDATNYVLMELGHPLHAFDYNLLQGAAIVVRKAAEGEPFTTLDNKERILTRDDLVICDSSRPIALAGIMGGLNSEVSLQTTDVLIESAYFDPVTIRKTSKRQGLQTDSSKRFERGTDPNNLLMALNRVTMLIQQVAGGQVCGGVMDLAAREFPEKVIRCRLSRVHQVLGIPISQGEIESIFQKLQFHLHWEGQEVLIVQVPTYRVDISSEIDLIEEIARFYGYDNIPRQGGRFISSKIPNAPIYLFEKEVQGRLIGEGLQEFLTCDLIGPSILNIVQDKTMPPEAVVTVLNPTSVEQSILRTSLLPGLLQVVKYNVDHQIHNISGFEIGRIHFKDGEQYKEQSVVGIILSGKSTPHHWDKKPSDYDFFDMKGIVDNFLKELGISNQEYKNLGIETFHSGRQASVFVNKLEVGSLGEIHPAILRRLDVPQRIFFAEFDLHDLIRIAKPLEKVKKLPVYPASERDWTVTVQDAITLENLLTAINEIRAPLLDTVSLLDVYSSEKLGKGLKNLTLRFVYRDLERTLSQEEVDNEHQNLVAGVAKKLQ